jgi:carboxypeptidase family protein
VEPLTLAEILGTVAGPDGARIAEASVYFLEGPVPLPDIAQLTDAEGGFQLTVPAQGLYRIGVRAPGFEPAEVTVEVRGEPEVAVEVRLTAPGNIPPSR